MILGAARDKQSKVCANPVESVLKAFECDLIDRDITKVQAKQCMSD